MKRVFLGLSMIIFFITQSHSEIGGEVIEGMPIYFDNEPGISEIQEAAIRYAEVHPDKIAKWRKAACVSALLPRLSMGIDRNTADNFEIYTSSTRQYIVEGPPKDTNGWDVTLTWYLDELIWNNDQTEIDTKSSHMAQLRSSILSKINELYFERRRLTFELHEAPPEGRNERVIKELRVQELSANIDALTGGFFSRRLNEMKNL